MAKTKQRRYVPRATAGTYEYKMGSGAEGGQESEEEGREEAVSYCGWRGVVTGFGGASGLSLRYVQTSPHASQR